MKKPTLVLVRGISGSGKSRLAQELAEAYGIEVFSTDDYFMTKDGRYEWRGEKLIEYHRKNIDRAIAAMERGDPFVLVDNTSIKAWELKPYVEPALKLGYDIRILEPTWSELLKDKDGKWNVDFIEELQNKPDRTDVGKSLPRHVLERMRDAYEPDLSIENILDSTIPAPILAGWKRLRVKK